MWGAHEGMGWWMLLGTLWFVVFWGLIVYLLISATSRSGNGSAGSEQSPLEILKRRYARGELTQEEYERMRRELT
jgi:putative membrane protein